MEFPILSKEIRVTLRRREAFFSAFLFYAILTSLITFQWILIREEPGLFLYREWAARVLFFGVLGLGFTLFCLHAGLAAARILVLERERKSEGLMRTAPIPAWRFLFQKLLTPFFVEWLYFLGILPVLSLIFLLGGVAPEEYAYQIANLAVWLNTSIALGLWISAGARSSGKARSKTIGACLFFALLLPFLATACQGVSIGLQNVSNLDGYKFYLREAVHFLAQASWPLITLSPAWMVSSWYAEVGGVLPIFGFNTFPKCPALLPWLILSGFQVLLFLATVRRWQKARDMTETAAPLRESRSLIALLKWVKRGRAARKPHPLRWRAFFQLEDSEVFKKGTLTKAVFAFAFVLFFGFLYRFIDSLDFGGNEGVRVFSNGILPLSGLIALLSALGYASNALRREKDRDCGVFLLTSPVEERSILFGKWLYYQSFALRILALGTIVSMVWRAFAFRDWQGLYSQENSPLGVWMTLPVMVAWIPLLSLFGIQQGLHSRFQSGAIRLLVPILILWLGGGILSLFFATLESSVRWSGVWRFFAWFLTEALSPALLFVAAVSAMAVKRLSPSPDSLHIVWRVALGSAWLSLALLDIFLGRLGWFQFFLFGERITFEEFRVYLRLMVLPLCASWLGWVYLATRSRLWWRKRLTSLESAA